MMHSADWVRSRITEIEERRGEEYRTQTASLLQAVSLAAAAPHSEEARDQISEWMEHLTATKEDEDHFLNPNAETDLEALKASGMYVESQPNG